MFSLNKNTIALSSAVIIVIVFFIAGLFNVLDYMIIKIVLFVGTTVLAIISLVLLFKNNAKKNRLEAIPQDDFH